MKHAHNFINLVGKKFGQLLVIRIFEQIKSRKIFWECKCDCGKEVIVSGAHLCNGSTKSCGCIRTERKPFCKRGHDTIITGRTPSNNCCECEKSRRQSEKFKLKHNSYMKNYNKENKHLLKKKSKKFRQENPEKIKNQALKHNFDITLEEYNKMFDDQHGLCLGCEKNQSEFTKAFCVDHDHKTGKIRGLLCTPCNLILGHAKDNVTILKRLIIYLQ